jgi:hypothetical protein
VAGTIAAAHESAFGQTGHHNCDDECPLSEVKQLTTDYVAPNLGRRPIEKSAHGQLPKMHYGLENTFVERPEGE